MHLLLNLIVRILSGEKIARSTPLQDAYWMSFLAAFPLLMLFGTWMLGGLESILPDQWIIASVFLIALLSFGLVIALARAFRRSPFRLIPVALATWGMVGVYFWKKIL